MGDGEKASLRLQFNPQIRLELHGATITSDAGVLAFRELDDALDLTPIASDYLQESRTGRNIRHHLVPLLRQSIYSRLAGYDDTNDAERLSQDPAMRVVVGWQGSDRNAARTNTMSRFETETLTQEDNLKGLALMNPQWVELAMAHTPHRRVILDMDSSESPVHGQQEGAAYNGHFECVCYHPLFLFNQFGDCEGATLRPGNVHSADGWQELLEPVVKGYQKKGLRLLFRGDAAFAKPELYEYLEQGKIGYAIRLPANQVIQEQIQPLLERPTEWPSREPIVSYHDFAYQAQSWHLPRRVVAKVEWHRGELFPRVGFIVTNLSYPPKGIVRFYNGRGTAEQWIKEGKYALNWTRLSCHKFVANQVRLWLFVLTYNLGNFMRRLVLPEDMKHWTLTSLQTRLIKTGGRLVRHARRLVMLWIEPINEIKLVALVVLLAAALLTGPVAGLALGWRHGRLGRLAGSALGLGVGVLSVMVVAVMMYEADQAEMVLIGPAADQAEMVLIGPAAFAEAGDLAPVAIGGEVRYALPVSGTEVTGAHHGPLYGRMTLTWALLYPIRVGAAILCTWFATTLLWSLGRMGARFVVRSR